MVWLCSPVLGGNVTLFKRTHASCAAGRDGTFVQDHLGMTVTSNSSYNCAGSHCATRVVATTLGNFEMHYFASSITPEKSVTSCDFATSFASANDFGSDDWVYSEWASQGTTFYVPSLHSHLKNWARHDVAYLGRYRSDVGGSSSPVYSARVVVPHTGHVVEVVSGVVGPAFSGNFTAYEGGECGAGAEIAVSLEAMDAGWTSQGGRTSNDYGLPDLLPVQLGQAVTDVAELPTFVEDYSGAVLNTTLASAHDEDDDCKWSSTTLELSTLESAWDVTLRLVARGVARRGGSSCHGSPWEESKSQITTSRA